MEPYRAKEHAKNQLLHWSNYQTIDALFAVHHISISISSWFAIYQPTTHSIGAVDTAISDIILVRAQYILQHFHVPTLPSLAVETECDGVANHCYQGLPFGYRFSCTRCRERTKGTCSWLLLLQLQCTTHQKKENETHVARC